MEIARMRRTSLLIALLAAGSACSDPMPMTGGGNGRTQVYLTDAPTSLRLSRVDLYIARIQASTSLDTIGSDTAGSGWVTIAEPQKTFNLLQLQQGVSVLAGEVDLPAG